jgi:hypothetical protein
VLQVLINGELVYEYSPLTRLPGHIRDILDSMDADMDSGIRLAGVQLARPDATQCAQYVAVQLLQAIDQGNAALCAACAAWLSSRQPTLRAIQAEDHNGITSMQLLPGE